MNDTVEIIIRTVNQALPGIKQAIKQLNLIEKAKIKLKDMPVSLKATRSFNTIRDRLRGITDSVKSKIPIDITGNDETTKTNTLINRLINSASKLKNIPVNLKVTKSFNTVRDRLKNIADSVKAKIPINISSERIDAATDRFKKFTSSIGGAVTKTVALGAALGVVGAATAAIGFAGTAVGLGSQLQQQQISMRHFIGVSNAGMDSAALDKMTSDYMEQLQKNANYTPFSQGEVMEAGTRALSVADGDTKKAMEFVKLAEDMAALNPGKTVMDAMEALADANVGEMERLKEFGFKMSADDFKAAGGDLFAMTDSKGRSLQGFYAGGAEKLSTSGAGLWSTITGNLESGVQQGGLKMLEALMPALQMAIPLSDQLADTFAQMGASIGGIITWLINGFTQAGGVIDYCRGIVAQLTPLFNQISAWATANMPMIQAGFAKIWAAIDPIIATVITLIGIFWQMFEAAWPILSKIGGFIADFMIIAIQNLCAVIQGIAGAFQWVFNIVQPILQGILDLITPIVQGLRDIMNNGGAWLAEKIGAKLDTSTPEPMSSGGNTAAYNTQQTNYVTVRSAEEAATFTAGALPGKYAAARG